MCIAIPGKVISIQDRMARVDFQGAQMDVNIGLVAAEVGSYVLVHAGCAIEVMQKDKALELIELFAELDALDQE